MSDKDMIIRGCEYWIKNHKGEQLILEYTAVEDLLTLLKEQEARIEQLNRVVNGEYEQKTAGTNKIPLKW